MQGRPQEAQGEARAGGGVCRRILQLTKVQQDEIAKERAAATAIGVDTFLGRTGAARARFHVRHEEEESDEGEFEDDGFEDYDVGEGSSIGSCPRTDTRSRGSRSPTRSGEHEVKLAGAGGAGNAKDDAPALPPKVVDVYTKYALPRCHAMRGG